MNIHRDVAHRSGASCLWTGRPRRYLCLFAATFLSAAGLAHAGGNTVTVQSQAAPAPLEAYAQVEPIKTLSVRASMAGVVTGMVVLPGGPFKSGQVLARLGGSEIHALVLRKTAELKSARTRLASARNALAFQRQQRRLQLATTLAVFQAESAAAQAQAAFDTARAQFRSLQRRITLKAPADGIVLSIDAGNGERVSTGQSVLTLQPAGRLWLRAAYYGVDGAAIRDGMSGRFIPADGGAPVPVKVATVFSAKAPDGGDSVGIVATRPAPAWLNGEYGKVILNGPVRSMVAVPTRALILDRGRWWVLVHTAAGEHPQAVTPGPTRGWQTLIEHGLKPGTEVVVKNAYLEFHRSISERYMPPD